MIEYLILAAIYFVIGFLAAWIFGGIARHGDIFEPRIDEKDIHDPRRILR